MVLEAKSPSIRSPLRADKGDIIKSKESVTECVDSADKTVVLESVRGSRECFAEGRDKRKTYNLTTRLSQEKSHRPGRAPINGPS